MAKIDPKVFLKDKRFWFASFLIAWAAGLQGHMMWLQKQESFQQKFGNPDESSNNVQEERLEKPEKMDQEWGNVEQSGENSEWNQK